MEAFAQIAVGRVLNSLPEGILIAVSAWLLLRVMGRQNAGTRFAVWMVALLSVALLPFLGARGAAATAVSLHAPFTVPASWALLFSGIWLAFAAVALARVAAGVLQVRRLRRHAVEMGAAELDPALQETLRQTKRRVRVLVSEQVRIPAAIGFFSPAIVLPAWTLRDLSPSELKPILIHELAHLRRRDDWTNLLQKAVRAALPFHPAVWWIDARLSMEREMACDDAVVAQTGNARGYAGCLIGLLERTCARRGWSMAQAAVARARDASVRIARILHAGTPATTRVGRPALALAGAACVTCCGVLLSAPRLLVFAPGESTASSVAKMATEENLTPPRTDVVPAMFHPAAEGSLVHGAMLKTAVSSRRHMQRKVERPSIRPRPEQRLAGRVGQPPLVETAARVKAAPLPVLADYVQPATKSTQVAAPVVIVFSMTQRSLQPPVQRSGAEVPAGAQAAMTGQLVQVQTVQVVEGDDSGFRIQVYRLVLVMPAQVLSESGANQRSI